MPDFRQYLTLDYWRAHPLDLSYGIAALVLFLGFLFATFPYSLAMESALAPLGLRFESSGQGFAFPMGAHLDNVSLRSSIEPGVPPYFESQRVKVWPALGSLLLCHPGISASAQAYSGTLDVHVHRSGDQAVISFDADKLNLAALHLLSNLGASLGGEISGNGKVSIDPIAPQDDGGVANVHAKGFTIQIPGGMKAVSLGDVNLTGVLPTETRISTSEEQRRRHQSRRRLDTWTRWTGIKARWPCN